MTTSQLRENLYDVIVCGAGHAGCEAALAASLGSKTLILTGNLVIAQMSSILPSGEQRAK